MGIRPDDLNEMWVSQYTDIPGIKDLIQFLKNRGLKVSVLSDNVPERIEYLQNNIIFLRFLTT
ncbi:MAG: hypothetical protein ACOX50_01410 [Patescibacteria group bacterium]|jgi:FMN phosphatase YigB (HAD superfamily)